MYYFLAGQSLAIGRQVLVVGVGNPDGLDDTPNWHLAFYFIRPESSSHYSLGEISEFVLHTQMH